MYIYMLARGHINLFYNLFPAIVRGEKNVAFLGRDFPREKKCVKALAWMGRSRPQAVP